MQLGSLTVLFLWYEMLLLFFKYRHSPDKAVMLPTDFATWFCKDLTVQDKK